ncbi:MAG: ATP-grasp domain-containing protein [Dehalococcoidia bacterium]|nr:ATP-grasp domain-containing protein [Dehalococcoidia bacterium]
MRPKVAIIYNEPSLGRYKTMGEEKAVLGVLDEVEAVHRALAELGYPVIRIPLLPPLEQVSKSLNEAEADLVFNLFEGFDGCPETEAVVADILSELGLNYTGCPGTALSLALDKMNSKARLKAAGINTPEGQLLSPENLHAFRLSYPCMVKPCAEDASHGISEKSVVDNPAQLEEQVVRISKLFGGRALVEEFVQGREFNVSVLGNGQLMALPLSEITYSLPPDMPRILTFSAKWEPKSSYFQCTKAVCPAEIRIDVQERIIEAALSAFRLLSCSGYARVDIRLNAEERPEVIEVNPNPDMAPGAGAANQAQAAGMTYNQFVEKIIAFAINRES